MRWLIGDGKGEGEEGVCAVGGLLFQQSSMYEEKNAAGRQSWVGVKSARTTSLIQPYDRELSQRSLVRDLTDLALCTSSQRVCAG